MTLRCRPHWLVASPRCNVGVLRCLTRRFIGSLLVVFYTWNLWYVYSSIPQVAVFAPLISSCVRASLIKCVTFELTISTFHCYILLYIYKSFAVLDGTVLNTTHSSHSCRFVVYYFCYLSALVYFSSVAWYVLLFYANLCYDYGKYS